MKIFILYNISFFKSTSKLFALLLEVEKKNRKEYMEYFSNNKKKSQNHYEDHLKIITILFIIMRYFTQ